MEQNNDFLPISKEDMKRRGIEQLDFVYVCGDAYVDHPSFGHAIITRLLESYGYTVGIIAQPDWKQNDSLWSFEKSFIANRWDRNGYFWKNSKKDGGAE